MKINQKMIEEAYDYGKLWSAGKISIKDAAASLHSHTGMNESSAEMYVKAAGGMISGEGFYFNITPVAFAYFFNKIVSDYGAKGAKMAIVSYEQHIHRNEKSGLVKLAPIVENVRKQLQEEASEK